ncbi:hypothetical protein L596_009728 [Steinernema carpocapsae]|uniref:Uncharacterized protein n=1 Tax=Steinernema carpocapsae TaxID=34508 RepID=A0A4U5PG75_STECR|nr:hypothetical protein L596_009728 [Steinernema carpocapsae]
MDQLPFDYIDSVAHLLSKNCAREFSDLHSDLWSHVRKTYKDKRVAYDIVADLHETAFSQRIFKRGTYTNLSTEHIYEGDFRYVRIQEFTVRCSDSYQITVEQLEPLLALISSVPVRKLRLYNVEPEFSKELWK